MRWRQISTCRSVFYYGASVEGGATTKSVDYQDVAVIHVVGRLSALRRWNVGVVYGHGETRCGGFVAGKRVTKNEDRH